MQMHAEQKIKGYVQMENVVRRYLKDKSKLESGHPSLADSLLVYAKELNLFSSISALSNKLNCLIEGYTTPSNAESLRKFLNIHNVNEPFIFAVDLLDIPSVYREMNLPFPEVNFILADASNLSSVFENGQFDLVVQDFLLNCAPPKLHNSILSEVHRILKKQGIALIQFSTLLERSLPNALTNEFVSAAIDRNVHSYSIQDIHPDTHQSGNDLRGKLFRHPDNFYYYVTPDSGNYEFYRDQHQIIQDFESNGLQLMNHKTLLATDSFEQELMRHYCLFTKCGN